MDLGGISIVPSNICTALEPEAIGSRVKRGYGSTFLQYLMEAMRKHDDSQDRIPGQHYIAMPPETYYTVQAGVGLRTTNESDYVARVHRGHVGLYLRRREAAEVEGLACVVYTRDAYLRDPDVFIDHNEQERIARFPHVTHILVAVLASAGPKSPYPGSTLLRNLAGANREALVWTADEIRAKAKESVEYWEKWAVVAD